MAGTPGHCRVPTVPLRATLAAYFPEAGKALAPGAKSPRSGAAPFSRRDTGAQNLQWAVRHSKPFLMPAAGAVRHLVMRRVAVLHRSRDGSCDRSVG